MQNSSIEWTHHTFNFVRGCTKVSEGCANCYAEKLSKRNPAVLGQWGPGKPRVEASPDYWAQPFTWDRAAQKAGERHQVFCASLADWLDEEIPIEVLAKLFQVIRQTRAGLDWLLLTKRPQNWVKRVTEARDYLTTRDGATAVMLHQWLPDAQRVGLGDKHVYPPTNVWIGVTVENQRRAYERLPLVMAIPAKLRFLSCEPLLSPLNLSPWMDPFDPDAVHSNGIHWVICGGESGPGARPMEADWARSLRDQCQGSHVPFFFKQWGGTNKKATGRALDGQLHDAFPA
jgi:protein gp37